MNKEEIQKQTNNLLTHLRDSVKGYIEVKNAMAVPYIIGWLDRQINERKRMIQSLETMFAQYADNEQSVTSILGTLHRCLIDVVINATSVDQQITLMKEEIQRGDKYLLDQYTQLLATVELDPEQVALLSRQKTYVQMSLDDLLLIPEPEVVTVT